MEVKPSDKGRFSRDRSGSQSSQAYSSNYYGRGSHRNFRKNSIPTRQYSRSHQMEDSFTLQDNSADAHKNRSGNRSPLPTGFQSHLKESPPYTVPIPAEQLHSSISEIFQHQSALDRLRATQMPLDPIDNCFSGNRKSNGSHEKSLSNKKENFPMKEDSQGIIPVTTLKKEQVDTFFKESKHSYHKDREGLPQQK